MKSEKIQKPIKIILFLVLLISLGINIRGYWVMNDLMEGNIEILADNFKSNTKIKKLIENNKTEEALEALNKRIEYEGTLLGITALSDNSQILKEKMNN